MCECIGRAKGELQRFGYKLHTVVSYKNNVESATVQLSPLSQEHGEPVCVVAVFCPFCGKRYAPKDKATV